MVRAEGELPLPTFGSTLPMPDARSRGAVSEIIDMGFEVDCLVGSMEQQHFNAKSMAHERDTPQGRLVKLGQEGGYTRTNCRLGFARPKLGQGLYIADRQGKLLDNGIGSGGGA